MNSLDPAVIDRFRAIVGQRLGLQFDDSKREFLGEVLQRRIERTHSGDALAYFQTFMLDRISATEAAVLAEELTVGETYFFRHPDQFRALTEVALLPRCQSQAATSRIRILSAGCASGEEAYSSAILLSQHVLDPSRCHAKVIGIDINPIVLAKAAQAQYSAWSLRGVPEEIRQRYFRGDRIFILDDSVRSFVSFENRNLAEDADDFWQPDRFDVIFCRNVMMYFTTQAARAMIARLTRSLVPGGFLFLGPAETLRGISQDYHLCHTHETFYYQRRSPQDQPTSPVVVQSAIAPFIEATVPMLASQDDSWVGTINQASERIERLSRHLSIAGPSSNRNRLSPQNRSVTTQTDGLRPDLRAVREMVQQERFSEALGFLHALSEDEGRDPDVQLLCAVIHTNRGEVAQAEPLCHQVLAGDELNAEAHYLLALCQEHGRAFDAAIEHDETAIYLDQRFAMPHLHLGLLRKRAGELPGARRAFQQAQALLPREDAARILLFSGGFSREMLIGLCEAECVDCEDAV